MCGHCLSFAPEYEKAAKTLASEGSQVVFAKVDAESERNLRDELNGQAFPVVKLYKNSVGLVTFDSATNAQDLIRWLYKKIGSPTRVIESVDDAATFLGQNNIVLFGFFNNFDSVDADTFEETAALTEEFHFAITNNSEVFDRYDVREESVYMFKRDDDEKIRFEDPVSVYNLQRFIKSHAQPLVCDYNSTTKGLVFGGAFNVQIWFALSKSLGDYTKYLPTIRKVAEDLRYRLFFVTIDTTQPMHRRLLKEFDITMSGSLHPRVFITKVNEDFKTYKADEGMEINEANIRKFVDEFFKNELVPSIPD